MHTIEVEKRVILEKKQRQKIEKELVKISRPFPTVEQLLDIYFCPETISNFDQIKMDKVNDYSLRIRKYSTQNRVRYEMNVKVITTKEDHNAWKEHEIQISSLREGTNILQTLGYKVFFVFKKERITYELEHQDVHICLEKIRGLGDILEIEILTTEDKSAKAKSEIDTLFDSLSITKDQVVKKTITQMLMEKEAVFDHSIDMDAILKEDSK